MPDFLVEIGTEELPPTSLKSLSNAFLAGIEGRLKKFGLAFKSAHAYATPRRLAVQIVSLDAATPLKEQKVWGAPAKVAFNADGSPGKAAESFAKKYGLDPTKLTVENDGKQDKLVHMEKSGGDEIASLLGDMVRESLAELPIAKRMRWGALREEFVRPVKWVLMLLDSKVLEETVLGVSTSNTSRGHRFHFHDTLKITSPQTYAQQLRETAFVEADFELRKQNIRSQIEAKAKSLKGRVVIDEDLLDEVTALVEWPVALAGNFDREFLQVPAEALISSMKEHQKYFHVVDKSNALMPCFITVANIESQAPEKVVDGNERVIRPRLADAAFFFETDKKVSLESQREKLKSVVFQAKLGSIFDKTQRIEKLANAIFKALSDNNEDGDSAKISRAASLCKSDLVTNMVYEFPDMQGIAGYHYALNDGEDNEVALAMNEQYMPKFSGDQLPETLTGAIIALADRLDTITGIFGIGQKPAGNKDPFALRRASLGALRILVEKEFALDLKDLITQAAENFDSLPAGDTVVNDVIQYMLDRFKSWYADRDIKAEVFQSVSAKQLTQPLDINRRVYAVAKFSALPEAEALAAANKRVSNILAKLDKQPEPSVNEKLLSEAAEKTLANKVSSMAKQVAPLIESSQYQEALTQLADLRSPIDNFFDHVMVMTDDDAVKNNRLALLHQLRELFLHVADISLLVVAK